MPAERFIENKYKLKKILARDSNLRKYLKKIYARGSKQKQNLATILGKESEYCRLFFNYITSTYSLLFSLFSHLTSSVALELQVVFFNLTLSLIFLSIDSAIGCDAK